MPGTHRQNSMFKKTECYVQSGNPFPVTSCGRRRNDGSPLFLTDASYEKSINLIAKIMRYLHQGKNPIYGFDSFEGLPEDWAHPETREIQKEGKKGHFDMGGNFPAKESDNIVFVKGWFDETLPTFVEQHPGPVALLHIDSDLYSSAKTIFDNLADRIVPGTVIMFDEFYNYDGFEAHEYKAFKEFVEKYNVTYKWITHVYDGRQASLIIESIEV